ncbi:hypothetical protein RCIA132 [Methanocella arvoryzae MRE50]|uniref:Uncharacterized protein n=1 Tax=Methanocella arvoryzae (strain DSM 22066 / NBRC 105507 / MRE50) TaxID=351160 RepID=Q0W446_METAR|nr:hypothetical protein RCIA132 [Methanocella arvoryzae MRE50]
MHHRYSMEKRSAVVLIWRLQAAKHAKEPGTPRVPISFLACLAPWRYMKMYNLALLASWRSWRYFRHMQGQLLIFHSLYLNTPFIMRRVLGGISTRC